MLVIPAGAQGQNSTRTACPGTFQVLHDDTIGSLRLAAGAYQITVANPARLPCARATADLAEFLRDYDGELRRPWTVDARRSAFQRGSDAAVAFSVARTGGAAAGGGDNPTANACPGYFDVLHNDHIGTFSVPSDAYRISLLSANTLSCRQAARLLTSFLQDYDGRLASPWRLNNATGTFRRGRSSTVGFRIKPAVGREPRPGSGGRHPAKGQSGECPGTFRVLRNDRIARLSLPAGRYLTFVYRGTGVSCAGAARLLRTFLGEQNVGRGYFVAPSTGVFSKGRRTPIFRVKPASPRGVTAG